MLLSDRVRVPAGLLVLAGFALGAVRRPRRRAVDGFGGPECAAIVARATGRQFYLTNDAVGRVLRVGAFDLPLALPGERLGGGDESDGLGLPRRRRRAGGRRRPATGRAVLRAPCGRRRGSPSLRGTRSSAAGRRVRPTNRGRSARFGVGRGTSPARLRLVPPAAPRRRPAGGSYSKASDRTSLTSGISTSASRRRWYSFRAQYAAVSRSRKACMARSGPVFTDKAEDDTR